MKKSEIKFIESALKIKLPESYIDLVDMGCFQLGDRYLWFSFCHIAANDRLLELEVNGVKKGRLIPFGFSKAGERWAWNVDWRMGEEYAVVYCDYGLFEVKGFASSFDGSIYRLMLEEMAGSCLVETAKVKLPDLPRLFNYYYHISKSLQFPDAWQKRLKVYSQRPLVRDQHERIAVISERELEDAIDEDLKFKYLNMPVKIPE